MWNEGAAFSLPIPPEVLPPASAAALALLAFVCRKDMWKTLAGSFQATLGVLAVSNFYERARRGRVYDYLQLPKAPKPLDRYVFNLADLCVLAGGALCLCRGGRDSRG